MKAFKIEHLLSTPYHPRGNAIVERVIQTLQAKLSLILSDDSTNATNWDLIFQVALLNVNTSYHKSLGYSPCE